MRQRIQFLVLLLVCTGLFGSAKAQNYVTIPDLNFLLALQEILPADVFNEAGEMNTDHEAVASLWVLDVKNRDIQSLEGVQYFSSLVYLDCSYNQLTELPELSQLLDVLNCENNQLTRFSALPPSLTFLVCNNNQLVELPLLPPLLEILQCDNNQLTDLPDLPQSLESLWCFSNQLTVLPELPGKLYIFHAHNNCFATMPPRPEWINVSMFSVSPNREDCLITGLASESESLPGIYPNPVEDVLYLGTEYEYVRVYDLGGREMGNYSSIDHIRTDDWSSGVYLIRVGERYVRVVKQ